MKVKDKNFGHEDFSHWGKKKSIICVNTKEKYNPVSEQGDMKMKDVCPESILISAVTKPDVDFVTDLVKQQTDEVPESFYSVYNWTSKSANVKYFFCKFICRHAKRKNIKNWITDKRTKQ